MKKTNPNLTENTVYSMSVNGMIAGVCLILVFVLAAINSTPACRLETLLTLMAFSYLGFSLGSGIQTITTTTSEITTTTLKKLKK